MKELKTITDKLNKMEATVATFGADAQRRFGHSLEDARNALERLARELRDLNMAFYREAEKHSEKTEDAHYTDDAEGRAALRAAMHGRKVYIDHYPYSHKGALNVLRDESGYGLIVEWQDATTLLLAVRFAE